MKSEIIEEFEALGEKAFRFIRCEGDPIKLIEGLDKLLSFYHHLDKITNGSIADLKLSEFEIIKLANDK